MRRIILFAVMIFLTFSVFAQSVSKSEEKAIREKLASYEEVTNAADWNKLMDFMYPKLFTVAPKEQLISIFSQMDVMGIKMRMEDVDIKEINLMESVGDEKFVIIPYSASIKMIMQNAELQKQEMVNVFKQQFATQFGEENVSFDQESYTFTMLQKKNMIAIYINDKSDWFFLDYDPATASMYEAQIFPPSVVEKIKLMMKKF